MSFAQDQDEDGQPMARWPIAPAAPITFTGIPLEYWREEVRLMCEVSMDRLWRICAALGASFELTIEQLK